VLRTDDPFLPYCCNQYTPIYLHDSNSEILNINTQCSSDLHTPSASLKTFQKGPLYFGIKIFNHLPTSIKNASHDINQFRSVLKISLLKIHFTRRNILLGIPIEILAQCNHFGSKHLNILSYNITQYHYTLLLLIGIFNSKSYIYINTYISRCSDRFHFQLVFKFCIVFIILLYIGWMSIYYKLRVVTYKL
jgi:hypothetical protein